MKNLFGFLMIVFCWPVYAQGQLEIPRVSQMPDFPSSYEMRDWKEVTIGYDRLIFSLTAEGQHLPMMSLGESGVNYPEIKPIFLDSYVGSNSHGQQREAINIIPAIVGATLAGVDKTNQYSINWVEKVRDFYNLKNGELVYLNGPADRSGNDWWYETMPNVFFYQLYDLYPDVPEFEAQFRSVADRWLEAVSAMGGKTTPWTIPEMNYRAWNLKTMEPLNEGVKEPEAAGAIAWILYQAYKELGDKKYLDGAQLALDFLNDLQSNPSYELQLPYGVLTAAKMNAEIGSDYAIEKMLGWCFSRGDLRGWGSIVGTWGGKDVSGLIGEANDQGDDYAFLMNGFQQAAALVPLVKYDKRFAAALGKWVLNVANASRLFYAPYLEANHQSDYEWSTTYDPQGYIAYEALKESWQGTVLYARGDAKDAGWAATNLGLYGSSHVGYLGAIVEETNVEGILKLDVNATDFYALNPFPTYLLYNPYETDKEVILHVGGEPVDLYDAVSETVIGTGVSGEVPVSIGTKSVLLVSYLPPESSLEESDGKLWAGDEVLDYHYGYDFTPGFRIRSLSATSNPAEAGVSDTLYCTLNVDGSFIYQWYVDGVLQDSDSASLVWKPEQVGTATVRVVVKGEQETVSDSLELEVVSLIPEKPVIRSLKSSQKYYAPETEVWIVADAYDPKNLPVHYSWSIDKGEVLEVLDDSAQVRLPESGIVSVELTVTNTYDLSGYAKLPVLVKAPIPERDPLVYLPLDGDVKDRSGNGYETSVQGTAFVADPLDAPDKSLFFNSSTDELRIANRPELNFTEAISVSFWLNATDFTEERFVISHGGWEQRWKVSVTTDQRLRWTINTTGGIKDLDTSFPLEKGSWYHFVVVYTGEVMELYAHGELDAFTPHSGSLNASDADITIGKRLSGDSRYYLRGSVDEVKVFDEAVGPDQVALLRERWWEGETMTLGTPGHGTFLYPNPAGTVVYLQHEQHPGALTILDLTGSVVRTEIAEDVLPGLYLIDLAGLAPGMYMLQFSEKSLKLLVR